jgi:hypothetical protein
MANVILLQDIYELKKRKEKELVYYKSKLQEIQKKLYWAEQELKITQHIIKIIEEETITKEIK